MVRATECGKIFSQPGMNARTQQRTDHHRHAAFRAANVRLSNPDANSFESAGVRVAQHKPCRIIRFRSQNAVQNRTVVPETHSGGHQREQVSGGKPQSGCWLYQRIIHFRMLLSWGDRMHNRIILNRQFSHLILCALCVKNSRLRSASKSSDSQRYSPFK